MRGWANAPTQGSKLGQAKLDWKTAKMARKRFAASASADVFPEPGGPEMTKWEGMLSVSSNASSTCSPMALRTSERPAKAGGGSRSPRRLKARSAFAACGAMPFLRGMSGCLIAFAPFRPP